MTKTKLSTIAFLALSLLCASPAHAQTAQLVNKSFAGIYSSPSEVSVSLKLENKDSQPIAVTCKWHLVSLPSGRQVSHGSFPLVIGAGGVAVKDLPFPVKADYGLYEYGARISSESYGADLEARVAVMRAAPVGREMESLGFNVHVASEWNAQLVRRLGLRWVRVDWNWRDRAVARDRVDWSLMDSMVSAAQSYGLKLFPVLTYTPTWAKLPDGSFDPLDHAAYVRSVLERYKGKLEAFNVWNEPESDPAINPSKNPQLWKADLEAVAREACAADPKCKIVGLALSANPGSPGGWYDLLLDSEMRLGQYLDAYDWHSYCAPRSRRPEEASIVDSVDNLKEWVPKVRSLVRGGQVWITEHGFTTCDPTNPQVIQVSKAWPPGAPYPVTEKQQGDYLVRQVLLELAYGIDKVFIYQLGPDLAGGEVEEQWGITRERPDGFSASDRGKGISAKVAYVQIANMVQELAGAKPVAVIKAGANVRIARFRRGKEDVLAAWTLRGEQALNLSLKNGYLSDPFGNRIPKRGKIELILTESPVYVVGTGVTVLP